MLRGKRLDVRNIAIVHIFFRESFFRGQNKGELVDLTDFLSKLGGLLGLFMGFSFFSVIELIYFMSLRPFFNRIRSCKKRGNTKNCWSQRLRSCLTFKRKRNDLMAKKKIRRTVYPYLEWTPRTENNKNIHWSYMHSFIFKRKHNVLFHYSTTHTPLSMLFWKIKNAPMQIKQVYEFESFNFNFIVKSHKSLSLINFMRMMEFCSVTSF